MRDFFDNLENNFLELDSKKRFLLLTGIIFLVLILIYYFLIVPIIESIFSNQEKVVMLDKKISKNSPEKLKSKIFLIKKEILKVKNRKEELNIKLLKLRNRLDSMKVLLVNKLDFNKFLNNLLKESINKNLLIKNVKILEEDKQFIGKLYIKKVMIIEGEGRFLDIISFVRSLEQNKMLFSIRDFIIEIDEGLRFSFSIDFYGV